MNDYIEDPTDKTHAIHVPSGQMAGAVFIGPAGADPISMADLASFKPIGWAAPFGWVGGTE